MDELNVDVDDEDLLTFESELIKVLKRTDIVLDLPLDTRLARMRRGVMLALEENANAEGGGGKTLPFPAHLVNTLNP